jgi:hypothetical protein
MRLHAKKIAAATAGTALALAASGIAFAYWTGTGSGSGSAASADGAPDLTITQTSTLTPIYPGGVAQTLGGTVKNKSTASAYVATVTAAITAVTAGCSASDYTLATPAMTVGQDIAGGATVPFSGATIAFNNKPDTNQDGCKSATVTITYSAS